MEIKGMTNLQKRITQLEKGSEMGFEIGLKAAGLHLQRASQQVVPVLTGNLKNSARTEAEGSGFNTVVVVGYFGVAYAVKVHEDLEAHHAPGKRAKFLEQPAREQRERMLQIIAKHTREGR